MAIILAIESSQHIGGIALRDNAGNDHVEMLRPTKTRSATGVRHDDDLLPAIDRLFRRAGCVPADLSGGAVGVSIGPGGFTGLRIAVSAAKMMAETLGTKVIAIPSAMVAAESWQDQPMEPGDIVLVALACKGDSCWITQLQRTRESWNELELAGLRDSRRLDLNHVSKMLADAHLPEPLRQLCEQSGVGVVTPRFDPRACLNITARLLREGKDCDPLTLSPLYPREPEAVTLWAKKISLKRE